MPPLTPEQTAEKIIGDELGSPEDYPALARAISTAIYQADYEAESAARQAGRAEGMEEAAKICDSWSGRRLEGHKDSSPEDKAWGRGVDMASYYIASDIRSASAASPAPDQAWMPIETAPKTGRTILLGRFNKSGKWRTMRGQWFSQAQIDEEWTETPDTTGMEGWYETSVEADDVPNCWLTDPSHWMPLPPAPAQEQTPEKGK